MKQIVINTNDLNKEILEFLVYRSVKEKRSVDLIIKEILYKYVSNINDGK